MAKAIYSLKIYIFRQEFKLTRTEEQSLADICIFIVKVYVKAWFTVPYAARAPGHDLQFLKDLYEYKSIDPAVSQVAFTKFANHLWYLTPELSATAFFDDSVSTEMKKKMVIELYRTEDFEGSYVKKLSVSFKDADSWIKKEISEFITPQSLEFFKRFEIDTEFLKSDPSLWTADENYKRGLKIVQGLKIVNDVAERAVGLMQKYINTVTKDPDQEQYILQVLSEYRKQFSDGTKKSSLGDFE